MKGAFKVGDVLIGKDDKPLFVVSLKPYGPEVKYKESEETVWMSDEWILTASAIEKVLRDGINIIEQLKAGPIFCYYTPEEKAEMKIYQRISSEIAIARDYEDHKPILVLTSGQGLGHSHHNLSIGEAKQIYEFIGAWLNKHGDRAQS